MKRRLLLLLILCIICIIPAAAGNAAALKEPPPLPSDLQSQLADWLRNNRQAPIEYVVRLFTEHDLVFLGEYHRIKHDPLLIGSLLQPLYRAGITTLAIEFGRREDQQLIDTVINSPNWNEKLAREILFRFGVYWGYQEYVNIYKAAWQLNRDLPSGKPRFRILGLNDSLDWSFVKSQADLNDPDIMKLVWKGGGEQYWAQVILDAVGAGQKVLVYSGIAHAFTAYRQPIVSDGAFQGFRKDLRCGNYVRNALGKRAITVFLHAPWNGKSGYESPDIHPADGYIDALMLAGDPASVGFDLAGGPFGELRVKDAVYGHGYDDFKLGDFCDGWIYTKPISAYEGVTPIRNWINAGNLATARQQMPNPAFRKTSAVALNRAIAYDADISRRFSGLR